MPGGSLASDWQPCGVRTNGADRQSDSVGRRRSKGEAKLQRCLMPLEIPEIERSRIVRRLTRDLDTPGKRYPRALGQLGMYRWTEKKPWPAKLSRPSPS